MRYVTAPTAQAEAAGIRMFGRLVIKGRVILHERDVINAPALSGGWDERIAALHGSVHTHREITTLINNTKTRQR